VELPGGAGPQPSSVAAQSRKSGESQASGAPGQGRAARDPAARDALRKWRLSVPLDGFRSIGKKFTEAGLSIFSYNLSFQDDFTDEEIDKGFQMTQALGTKTITASSPLSVFPRLVPFAEKYKITVAGHNHSSKDPNALGGPEAFDKILSLSKYFEVNLDIGHFVALNYDPVPYIRQHHTRITNLHLKDRKKNLGPTVEWGTGDTPVTDVLQLLKKEKYPILACIEQTGPEGPSFVLKKCLQFCKDALA
jgi:sugar phosphate isomerase/epimerase